MGINAELVRLVADLRRKKYILGDSVIELGAQDVCVVDQIVNQILSEFDFAPTQKKIECAQNLYSLLGFKDYRCIDASGSKGALLFDLNEDIRERYSFDLTSDLVTNLGTAEHCFDQRAVFKNLHDLCKPGGVMIHALPAQGNVNHGFYNYHPRFFVDLATANSYEVIDLSFTVDYMPALKKYSKEEFKRWDSHDLLFYAVLRKTNDAPFKIPFDGMFTSSNRLAGYVATDVDPLVTEFSPYLKAGDWKNTKGMINHKVPPIGNRARALIRRLFSGRS